MKSKFRQIVRSILMCLAQRRLEQVKPQVIGVTGSVGKTSAKEAIVAVLSRRFKVHKNSKNFNSDFGALITILEKKSGHDSPWKWFKVVVKSLVETFGKVEGYEKLVMEMGVDKPGDMSDILEVVRPNIMVFLNVKDVHMAEGQFANKEAIFDEKSKSCVAVPPQGWVILNQDDHYVRQLKDKLPAETLMIGTSEGADLRAMNVKSSVKGLSFELSYEDKVLPVSVPNVLGECYVGMALAAIAVGFLNGLPWNVIEAGLKDFELPPGRMNLIDGRSGSVLIDSSYNASPAAMEEALKVLGSFSGRKIAALGSMNELGELADSAHVKVGKLAAEYADMLVAVGHHSKEMAEGAHRAGMSASLIHSFRNSKEAGAFVAGLLQKGDVVLAKGSQNKVRMEHLVKACMAEPEQARYKLVRQEPYWLKHL